MKFIVDECVGRRVSNWLMSLGHEVIDVLARLSGIDDESILKIASKNRMCLITKDGDFGRLVYWNRMDHNGVIYLKLGRARAAGMIEALSDVLSSHSDELHKKFITVRKWKTTVRYVGERC